MKGISPPTRSAVGEARIYFDPVNLKLKFSENGSDYYDFQTTVSTGFASIDTIISNTTLTVSNYTVLANAVSAPITISLPAAASVSGKIYVIKKIDQTSNLITVDPYGSELIDNETNIQIGDKLQSITIHSNGTGWWVL